MTGVPNNTPEQIQFILDLYRQGVSRPDIAARCEQRWKSRKRTVGSVTYVINNYKMETKYAPKPATSIALTYPDQVHTNAAEAFRGQIQAALDRHTFTNGSQYMQEPYPGPFQQVQSTSQRQFALQRSQPVYSSAGTQVFQRLLASQLANISANYNSSSPLTAHAQQTTTLSQETFHKQLEEQSAKEEAAKKYQLQVMQTACRARALQNPPSGTIDPRMLQVAGSRRDQPGRYDPDFVPQNSSAQLGIHAQQSSVSPIYTSCKGQNLASNQQSTSGNQIIQHVTSSALSPSPDTPLNIYQSLEEVTKRLKEDQEAREKESLRKIIAQMAGTEPIPRPGTALREESRERQSTPPAIATPPVLQQQTNKSKKRKFSQDESLEDKEQEHETPWKVSEEQHISEAREAEYILPCISNQTNTHNEQTRKRFGSIAEQHAYNLRWYADEAAAQAETTKQLPTTEADNHHHDELDAKLMEDIRRQFFPEMYETENGVLKKTAEEMWQEELKDVPLEELDW